MLCCPRSFHVRCAEVVVVLNTWKDVRDIGTVETNITYHTNVSVTLQQISRFELTLTKMKGLRLKQSIVPVGYQRGVKRPLVVWHTQWDPAVWGACRMINTLCVHLQKYRKSCKVVHKDTIFALFYIPCENLQVCRWCWSCLGLWLKGRAQTQHQPQQDVKVFYRSAEPPSKRQKLC